MFRDECELHLAAGRGGNGMVSFRREAKVPKGGPDGGDGGNGGSVIFVATSHVSSLLTAARTPHYRATNGAPGGTRDKSGAGGVDRVIEVPIGTQIYDRSHGNLLRDLDGQDVSLVAAAGGRGGRGNARFKNSIRQTPREAESGRPGEERGVRLELKLFAEVGLVGLPNAGKSTFLAAVTKATPKVADYPFTTLVPQVGIATVGDFDTLVIADLPGLIRGAAGGAGLGHQFLRHVERCRVLLHLIDVSSGANTEPERAHEVLAGEIAKYSSELAERPRLVVATKVEDDESRERARKLSRALECGVLEISSATGDGIEALLVAARGLVRD